MTNLTNMIVAAFAAVLVSSAFVGAAVGPAAVQTPASVQADA